MLTQAAKAAKKKKTTKRGLLQSLGPGLIAGAADDDPSGIATYSQAGAQFGYSPLWVLLFSYPLMVGIQEVSAHIGRVTGRGIAGNLRRHFPAPLLYMAVGLMVVANVINLGADIGAMGAAAALLIPGPPLLFAAVLTIGSLLLQTFAPYDKYAGILKWLTLALFAYVGTVFVVHVPWLHALRATILPSFRWNADYVTVVVGVLGTTISPYLFFWQAGEEVEAEEANPREQPLIKSPRQAPQQFRRIALDTATGMAFSEIVAFFIMLTGAVTLHAHGLTNVQTATDAALALKPVAGKLAFLLFAVGIIGTGLLAVPVLAGSAAYAAGEVLQWPVGLARQPLHARGFYGVLAAATLIGLALNVHIGHFAINPIKALFWSAVINGVVAGPIMILMMLLAQSTRVMGPFTLNTRLRVLGWLSTAAMLLAAVGMFATWGH